jgi:hypothetical protein
MSTAWLTRRLGEIAVMFSDLFGMFRLKVLAKKTVRGPAGRTRSSLVKSRPASLEQRYRLVEDEDFGNEVFGRLQQRLFMLANQGLSDRTGQKIVYKERGRMAPGRPYFFLKPHGSSGLLFERSGPGWVVSRAEKIVDRDLFLRDGPVLEHANVFLAADRSPLPRIKSDSLGNELLAFAVYEQKLLRHLGLE